MSRSIWIYAVLTLAIAFALTTGCNGKGGDGAPVPSAGTVKASFMKDAHRTSVGPWLPAGHFDAGTSSWRAQHLYSGTSGTTQISGSGYITAIGFKVDAAVLSAITCTGVTIRMGHTSLGALTTTFTNNYGQSRGSVMTVLDSGVVTIPPITAGGYFLIALDRPFHFNGVEKLVVDFVRAGACTGTVALRYDDTVPANQALYSGSIVSSAGTLTFPPNMRFRFSGGNNTVEFGGSAPASEPFTTTPTRIQLRYAASEINGTGPITGLGFQVDQLTTEQTYSYSVTMGHTSLAALAPTFAANIFTGTPALVANGIFTVPANISAGSYIWIPLTGAFTYNGLDDLLVDIQVSAGTGDTVLRHGVGTASRRVAGAMGAALGINDDWAYHTRFRIQGGTMDVLTPNGMFGADSFPLASNVGMRQYLYRATELGSGGTIAGIACRNAIGDADAIDPLDGMDLTIVVSHTTATMLGADFALNMPQPATVFNGPFATTPTAWGDWIEFPFSTPFIFSGADNLVVQLEWTGFQPGNPPACAMDTTSTGRYPARRAWGPDPAAAVADEVNAYLMDLRFTIQ